MKQIAIIIVRVVLTACKVLPVWQEKNCLGYGLHGNTALSERSSRYQGEDLTQQAAAHYIPVLNQFA